MASLRAEPRAGGPKSLSEGRLLAPIAKVAAITRERASHRANVLATCSLHNVRRWSSVRPIGSRRRLCRGCVGRAAKYNPFMRGATKLPPPPPSLLGSSVYNWSGQEQDECWPPKIGQTESELARGRDLAAARSFPARGNRNNGTNFQPRPKNFQTPEGSWRRISRRSHSRSSELAGLPDRNCAT